MWYKTEAARLLGIAYPILQGPFYVVPAQGGHGTGKAGYDLILGRADITGTKAYEGKRTDGGYHQRNNGLLYKYNSRIFRRNAFQ